MCFRENAFSLWRLIRNNDGTVSARLISTQRDKQNMVPASIMEREDLKFRDLRKHLTM